jgi:hypothetical protein
MIMNMGLIFSNETVKEELNIRNNIFIEVGIPPLIKKGFEKSPFSTAWYGKDNLGNYNYELCRLNDNKYLEIINVFILKGDKWIQIFLNIFEINPSINSIEQLKGMDGLKFSIRPNSLTKMRLRADDHKGVPLFNMLFAPKYKLGFYYSKESLTKQTIELSQLIENDMNNINTFIDKWHNIHTPALTNWKGERI